jgi:glycerol-3-phosphate acyltransferase PlsY
MQHAIVSDVAALILGYGLGSIPFGLLLTRLAGTSDIRTIGSGNIGATNVLRTGRKDLAAATLLLDGLKGTAAVLIAHRFGGEPGALVAAVGAFFGHLFPVWLGFRGGKGVATYLGCLFGIWWPIALVFSGLWLATAFLLRYSSAAALVASAASPLLLFAFGRVNEGLVFLVLALVLWWKHRANLSRLLAGTESRIGHKA